MEISELAKNMLIPGYSLGKVISENINTFNKSSESSSLQQLKENALREDIKAGVLQNQAKVEQELAIARRIDSAEEVEIEEYYDVSGKGNLGLKAEEGSVALGAGGEGRKVTKRIIKFKGCRPMEQHPEA